MFIWYKTLFYLWKEFKIKNYNMSHFKLAILISILLFTSCSNTECTSQNKVLQDEKVILEKELSELIIKYDESIQRSEHIDDELVLAKEQIIRLYDSLDSKNNHNK